MGVYTKEITIIIDNIKYYFPILMYSVLFERLIKSYLKYFPCVETANFWN